LPSIKHRLKPLKKQPNFFMTTQNITANVTAPQHNLQILKQNFPQCFDKNGDFDLTKFQKELESKEVEISKESYGMDWLGKSYARLLAADPAKTLLKEDTNWNSKDENKDSQNLLLKGDNLEVLKHLSNTYYQKVKMIYIDPPYNTGSDGFVYADDRKFTVAQFSELAGVDEEQAKKILSFVNSKSNSHSAWLTFMYPRLYIARQLLKDDGVIFVSIDDNEVAQLRLVMDEIFGEENFVGELVFQSNSIKNNAKQLSVSHEYTLIYVKNLYAQDNWRIILPNSKEMLDYFNSLKLTLSDQERSELMKKFVKENKIQGSLANYTCVENNKLFRLDNIGGVKNGNTKTKIIHPNTKKECKMTNNGWRFSDDKISELLSNNLIYFGIDEKTVPQIKRFLEEEHKAIFNSVIYKDTSQDAKQLAKLFNSEKIIFEFPKNIEYIKSLISLISNNSDTDIILDFFAGSGTTGDAVMQLNAKDGGNRKFILVQLPELIDEKKNKTAFDFVKNELKVDEPTIFEITKERLVRAGRKIGNEKLEMKNGAKKTKKVLTEGQKLILEEILEKAGKTT